MSFLMLFVTHEIIDNICGIIFNIAIGAYCLLDAFHLSEQNKLDLMYFEIFVSLYALLDVAHRFHHTKKRVKHIIANNRRQTIKG